MYELIDTQASTCCRVVCRYKAKTVAMRDCEKMNLMFGSGRYIVKKPNGGLVIAGATSVDDRHLLDGVREG